MSCKDPGSFIRPQLARVRDIDFLPYLSLMQLIDFGNFSWSNVSYNFNFNFDYHMRQFERYQIDYKWMDLHFGDYTYVDIQDVWGGLGIDTIDTNILGLIGHWPCSPRDENGGVIDISGNNLTLTDTGDPVSILTPGGAGGVDLNGTDEYLTRADEAVLDIIGDFTVGLWVSLDTWTNFGYLASKGTTTDRGWALYTHVTAGDQRLRLILSETGALWSGGAQATNLNDWVLGKWYHVAARWDSSDDTNNAIFRNGGRVSESLGTGFSSMNNSTGPFNIGHLEDHPNYTDGRFSDIWLARYAMSDSEINQIYLDQRSNYA